MIEASSLLPLRYEHERLMSSLALRFGCEMAVLVGDPKQLSPTLAGVPAEHTQGLEQTLFDRYCDSFSCLSDKL